ncbi:MAG: 4Fe-4S binding protein [Thermoplasmata archaeon]|nr:4Fe-4S binding protein [Thermoplasmata archaeon]
MMLNVTHIDLGGCEGCSVALLRAMLNAKNCKFKSRLTGDFDADGEVVMVSGPICMNDPEKIEMLKELRKKAKLLIAFGSCAAVGGITRYCRGGQQPKPHHMTFQPINAVVTVDYAIPGCPPSPRMIQPFMNALADGKQSNYIQIFKAVTKVKKLSGFDLIDDIVLQNICISCGACVLSCPTGAMHMVSGKPDLIVEKCIRCGTCYVRCPRASQLLIRRYLK